MSTLLRLQALVLWRSHAWGFVAVGLLLAVALPSVDAMGLGGLEAMSGLLILGLVVPIAGSGMIATLAALDRVRWALPVRGVRILAAHYCFWGLLGLGPAILLGLRIHRASANPGLALACSLGALVTILATPPVFTGLSRGRPLVAALAALVAIPGLVALGVGSAFAAGQGATGMALFLALLPGTAALYLGVRAWSRGEVGACGVRNGLRWKSSASPDSPATESHPQGRSPGLGLWLGSLPGLIPGLFLLLLLLWAAVLPQKASNILHMTVVAAVFFTMDRLGRVHWLLATPMSRARMFRMVAIPLVAIPLLSGLVTLVAETSGGTRGVLANRREVADRPYVQGALSTTDIGAEIPSVESGGGWTSPTPEVMAERLRANLRKRFLIEVPPERIVTRLEPLRESSGPMKSHASARLGAALDEIQGDLEVELLAADRVLRCLYVAAGLILVLLVLQLELHWRFGRGGSMVLVVFTFLLTLPEGPSSWQAPLRWRDGLMAAVVALPVIGQVLFFLGVAAVALALWRSCLHSFRRMDSSDFRGIAIGGLFRPK